MQSMTCVCCVCEQEFFFDGTNNVDHSRGKQAVSVGIAGAARQ